MWCESVGGAQLIDMIVTNMLPVLSVNGKRFTQSLAALIYAGKKSNLKLSLSVSTPYFLALLSTRLSCVHQQIFWTSLLSLCHPSGWISKLLNMCWRWHRKTTMKPPCSPSALNMPPARCTCLSPSSPSAQRRHVFEKIVADLAVYYSLLKMVCDADSDCIATNYIETWPALASLEKALPDRSVVKVCGV